MSIVRAQSRRLIYPIPMMKGAFERGSGVVKCGSLWTRNWKRTTSFEYGYTLGSVTDHALTHGVGSLSSSGFRGGAVAKGGTTVVASWSDGAPLVGYKTLSAGQLWKNAVHFAGAAGGPARVGVVAGGN